MVWLACALANFALFHLVTVFPPSWVTLFANEAPVRFLIIEALGAVVGLLAVMASGLTASAAGPWASRPC
ncbi:hypothetical protein [Caulobacter sp. DWP3-1-3b2]|uniref:hypothetical protein n=1 Tax=Caulobacter sp. DWP3-1-3b2 TaxID=2804643 RepID=UPI003CF2F0C9